jgi:hypothetical protein
MRYRRRTDEAAKEELYPATALWNEAEEPFFRKSTEADVLAILDCCFASYAHKGQSNERRMYELLAACEKDKRTPRPGPKSFTNAFIQTVRKLLDQDQCGSFTTEKLLSGMNDRDSKPELWDRLRKDDHRHIHLAPLDTSCAEEKEKRFQERPREKANLKLRFSLVKPDMSKEQLEKLGEALPGAFETAGIPLRGIEWMKMEKRDPVHILRKAVKTLGKRASRRKSTQEKLKQQEGEESHQQGLMPDAKRRESPEMTIGLTPRKRARTSSFTTDEDPNLGLYTPSRSSVRSRSTASDDQQD